MHTNSQETSEKIFVALVRRIENITAREFVEI